MSQWFERSNPSKPYSHIPVAAGYRQERAKSSIKTEAYQLRDITPTENPDPTSLEVESTFQQLVFRKNITKANNYQRQSPRNTIRFKQLRHLLRKRTMKFAT